MAYGMNLVKRNNANNTLELVEGVNAIGAAITLAKRLKIELPIVNAINQILNKNGNIREIIPQLLSRPIKDEF
jgi:glycerol-3-phosphate dehydrogenase (NAD(P)+)